MSSPIPTAIACLSESGIAVIRRSRRPTPAVSTKQHSGHGDATRRHLPRNTASYDDREDEIEVVSHRGRHRNGVVGEERHHQGRDPTPDAGGHEHGAEIHPGRTERGWLHEDDVGQREESRAASEDLGPNGRAVLGQVEQTLEYWSHASGLN